MNDESSKLIAWAKANAVPIVEVPPAFLGQTTVCWNCGKRTPMWWEGGDRPVCEHCESFLDLPGKSQINGEIFVAADGEVFDRE